VKDEKDRILKAEKEQKRFNQLCKQKNYMPGGSAEILEAIFHPQSLLFSSVSGLEEEDDAL
jgi:hypothetical protein